MYVLKKDLYKIVYFAFIFTINLSHHKRTSYERKHFIVKTEPFRGSISHLITINVILESLTVCIVSRTIPSE